MDFKQKDSVSLLETAAGTAPAFEWQTLTSPPAVADQGKIANPDLNALLAALEHERIAAVAYFCWQQRGCPEGSPEADWFQAVQHIREG